ncbi:MAG: hypothetical protein Ct9H300mP1_37820 [Planctomycetaceae bacterium]|nr:MAG: hypothetical protein Ct9H300mP1_37820 [Planctomycetaceae bacterium]
MTEISCPLLLMLSGGDRIIDNVATRELFEGFRHRKKRLLEYDDAAHTLEFEPSREQFVADLIGWLDELAG